MVAVEAVAHVAAAELVELLRQPAAVGHLHQLLQLEGLVSRSANSFQVKRAT